MNTDCASIHECPVHQIPMQLRIAGPASGRPSPAYYFCGPDGLVLWLAHEVSWKLDDATFADLEVVVLGQ